MLVTMANVRIILMLFITVTNRCLGNRMTRLETRIGLLEERIHIDSVEFREKLKGIFSILNDTLTDVPKDVSNKAEIYSEAERNDFDSGTLVSEYIVALKRGFSQEKQKLRRYIDFLEHKVQQMNTDIENKMNQLIGSISDDIGGVNASCAFQAIEIIRMSNKIVVLEARNGEMFEKLQNIENTTSIATEHVVISNEETKNNSNLLSEVIKEHSILNSLVHLSLRGRWTMNEGSYYYFGNDLKNWNDAAKECETLGSYLAEVDSSSEMEFLQTLSKSPLNKYSQNLIWLGGSDINYEGSWVWRRGNRKMEYTNWNLNEPNGYTRENCLQAHGPEGHWNDLFCGVQIPYVCEADVA